MRNKEMFRTEYAGQATSFAQTLNLVLRRTRLTPGEYVPELMVPEGPSTAGGVQARQALRLVPQLPGYPTIVFGAANPREGTAELRTFPCVDAIHWVRFRRGLNFDRAAYDKLIQDTERLLETFGLRTTLVHEATLVPSFPPPPALPSGSSPLVAFLLGALLMAFVAAVVVFMFLARR